MNRAIGISAFTIATVALLIVVWGEVNTPKTGFVRISYLLENYKGMQETKDVYQSKLSDWGGLVDSLSQNYDSLVAKYQSVSPRLSADSNQIWVNMLMNRKAQIQSITDQVTNLADMEDQKMSQQVLNRVNDFVKRYGYRNGYKYIYGATMAGSILYAEDSEDITEKILLELNDEYINGSQD